MSVISREQIRSLCANYLPIPNPVAAGKKINLTHFQKDGEIVYLFPDIDFHFFLIMANEEFICQEKKKIGIRYAQLVTSLN